MKDNILNHAINKHKAMREASAHYDKVKTCTYKQRLTLRIHAVQYQREPYINLVAA